MPSKDDHKIFLAGVETKLKSDKRLFRSTIQECVNALKYKNMDLEEKKVAITDMINRLGIKVYGLKTMYTPRSEFVEEEKTLDFLSDLKSYYNFDK